MSESANGCMSSCGEVAAGFVLLGLLAIGGLYYWYTQNQAEMKVEARQAAQRLQARRGKIRSTEIAITDFRLSSGSFPQLTGRIANHASRDSIDMVDFIITVYDCPSPRAGLDRCAVIAEDSAVALELIPPGQSRDFRSYVRLPQAIRIHGRMRWSCRIASVTAVSP